MWISPIAVLTPSTIYRYCCRFITIATLVELISPCFVMKVKHVFFRRIHTKVTCWYWRQLRQQRSNQMIMIRVVHHHNIHREDLYHVIIVSSESSMSSGIITASTITNHSHHHHFPHSPLFSPVKRSYSSVFSFRPRCSCKLPITNLKHNGSKSLVTLTCCPMGNDFWLPC